MLLIHNFTLAHHVISMIKARVKHPTLHIGLWPNPPIVQSKVDNEMLMSCPPWPMLMTKSLAFKKNTYLLFYKARMGYFMLGFFFNKAKMGIFVFSYRCKNGHFRKLVIIIMVLKCLLNGRKVNTQVHTINHKWNKCRRGACICLWFWMCP